MVGVALAGAVHGGRHLTRDKTAAVAGSHRAAGDRPGIWPAAARSEHWTGRRLAKAVGVSLRSVQRILEVRPKIVRSPCQSADAVKRAAGYGSGRARAYVNCVSRANAEANRLSLHGK